MRAGGGAFEVCLKRPYHDVLLHGDVYEGERSSVDEYVSYSEETTLDEVTQPNLSRCSI